MATVNKTVREVFEALEKNGFEHIRGEWILSFGSNLGACILGQAALNLRVNYHDDFYGDEFTLLRQLNKFEVPVRSFWFVEENNELGSVIIYWNDLEDEDGENPSGYVLDTYAEVVAMAKELMGPHFDEILTLTVNEFKWAGLELREN